MSHLFEINYALQEGQTVSIPADRVFGSSKTLTVQLLGAEARLPEGPFRVAAMRGLDVLAVNVMKEHTRSYRIYVTPLHYDKQQSRSQQVQELAKGYVAELERMLRLYPAQWYNYFEFWT